MKISCNTPAVRRASLQTLSPGEAAWLSSRGLSAELIVLRCSGSNTDKFVVFDIDAGKMRVCSCNGFVSTDGFECIPPGTEIKITL
jgi:hypothetical protein